MFEQVVQKLSRGLVAAWAVEFQTFLHENTQWLINVPEAPDGTVHILFPWAMHRACEPERLVTSPTEVRRGLATLLGHELQPAVLGPRKLCRAQVHHAQLHVVDRHALQQDRLASQP